ncbi:MAG: hypothetical protein ACI9D5_002341 [Candidatus Endobugula sp.]
MTIIRLWLAHVFKNKDEFITFKNKEKTGSPKPPTNICYGSKRTLVLTARLQNP